MQTQLTLNIDSQTIELAKLSATQKGVSINELFENYIRLIVLNEQLSTLQSIDINTILLNKTNNTGLKRTNWLELDKKFMSIRKGLPNSYKFDRELANER